ncbi:uncharacterized protein [Coffea arabica]|uniref:Helitron helicase-like domain-containing protein n=1 Tax=Coffea arabica TaxID=13443 RepID=A0ABM4VHK0_COFAR
MIDDLHNDSPTTEVPITPTSSASGPDDSSSEEFVPATQDIVPINAAGAKQIDNLLIFFSSIEHYRLNFMKTHQSLLRADVYQGLEDAVLAGDTDASAVGRRFVLPSSFSGGSRNMVQHFQDAMAIYISVIEFQKRGLPHTHITLTLAPKDKPLTTEHIDEIICAEIPDKNADPLAYDTVIRCMLHGPCGNAYPNAPCMVNGKCPKHYPKKFCSETTIDEDGFVSYRRRDDPSKRVTINGFIFDNRWVVSYNRYLIVMFDDHINVTKVARPEITKYLYKHMSKGVDRANIHIENNVVLANESGHHRYRNVDEIKQYLDCRYLSPIESCWKIFDFEMQRQYPSVIRLQYHLPDHQFVIFNDDNHLYDVLIVITYMTRC